MARHAMPTALTRSEEACLEAYGELWSYAAVGRRLGIAKSTVRNHLSNARSKLGARKTGEALQIYARSRRI